MTLSWSEFPIPPFNIKSHVPTRSTPCLGDSWIFGNVARQRLRKAEESQLELSTKQRRAIRWPSVDHAFPRQRQSWPVVRGGGAQGAVQDRKQHGLRQSKPAAVLTRLYLSLSISCSLSLSLYLSLSLSAEEGGYTKLCRMRRERRLTPHFADASPATIVRGANAKKNTCTLTSETQSLTLKPKFETVNPHPQPPNPKPQIPIPNPQTLNPKP